MYSYDDEAIAMTINTGFKESLEELPESNFDVTLEELPKLIICKDEERDLLAFH